MRAIFDARLQELWADLLEMAHHVDSAVSRASDALLKGDVDLAQVVIDDDRHLDEIEERVDERCVQLIAQQQPVGADLRTIIVALRISASLERMGDLAQHIAEAARRAYPDSPVPPSHQTILEEMAVAARHLTSLVPTMVETSDLKVAEAIFAGDDDLDRLHEQAYATLLDKKYKGKAQETLDIALLARFYERIGDHAVGVARRIVYLVTGDISGDAGII